MRSLYLFHLLTLLSIGFANACKNDEDCSLNGICSRWKKACRCDPGWIGSDCGRLDLAPATRYTGYNHTYEPPSPGDFGIWPNASWGGRIIQDRDNKRLFHLFTVQFSHGCGLKGWRPHSYIIRAESHSGPQGPYKYAHDVSKNFAHNPDIVWSQADKKYLLYSIGNDKQQWPRVGSHLFSRKLTGPWHFKLQEAFSSNVTFTDGSWQVFKRRERPKLFFSDDGEMTPLYLTNGVQEMNQTGAAFTLVQPVGTRWKRFEKDLGF
ncbi:hypothetical protein FOC1_g10004292 [Fusarium oxysporum f. sp. cubense race 1]|uniref:EGF-like domain-containing protein n=1 Tax=Fusarium oxysporum f. sp. cubense (strain race 1) TaxID=1229664 RepID=N4TLX9_FUSC1|nr:hypothetical protein FOC1_g10004292 [Fusarium oxysporum f. sp. cubense race 1]